jgi:FRG domain
LIYDRRGRLEFARHYGVPSPLIDFSLSPYVALFFAFNGVKPLEAKKGEHAAIYCLNVFELAGVWARQCALQLDGSFPAPNSPPRREARPPDWQRTMRRRASCASPNRLAGGWAMRPPISVPSRRANRRRCHIGQPYAIFEPIWLGGNGLLAPPQSAMEWLRPTICMTTEACPVAR